MVGPSASHPYPTPTIVPLGDSALLVRFGTVLSDMANQAAIALALTLDRDPIPGVVEVVPNLVSVLLRYEPVGPWSHAAIAGELRLRLHGLADAAAPAAQWRIAVTFDGPDLDEVAGLLGLARDDFVASHNRSALRVLATGFAPGFVYCGLHPEDLILPRRMSVRPMVPAGSVLFAAGQTAIAATEMPTGWHWIGRTDFANFDASANPPTRLSAGDGIVFEVAR